MSEQHAAIAVCDDLRPATSSASRAPRHPGARRRARPRVVQLVPIDEHTWAIRGSIAVDGEVILAEFDNPRGRRARARGARRVRARHHRALNAQPTSKGRIIMKIVVIGGTGLIGSNVVTDLQAQGHDAVAASPNSGVNTLTGEGLAEVLEGAVGGRRRVELAVVRGRRRPRVLRDLDPQHPRRDDGPPAPGTWSRCRSSGATACPTAGTCGRRSRRRSSSRRRASPFSIVHATQFFEFIGRIADEATDRRRRAAAVGALPTGRRRRRRRGGGRGRRRRAAGGHDRDRRARAVPVRRARAHAPRGPRRHARRSSPIPTLATSTPSSTSDRWCPATGRLLPTTYAEWVVGPHPGRSVSGRSAFVPRFLDGSLHIPRGRRVRPRTTDRPHDGGR